MKLEEAIQQKKFNDEFEKMVVNLIYTSSRVESIFESFFKFHKLTSQQYNILRILRGQYPKPASVNLLIERMLDKMSNASRLVDKLLAKGFVERKLNERDHRQVDVIITERGLELLGFLDIEIREVFTKMKTISEEEAAQLNNLLDKLRG